MSKIWNIVFIALFVLVGLVLVLMVSFIGTVLTGYIFFLLGATPFSVMLLFGMIIMVRLHAEHAWGYKFDDENEAGNLFYLVIFLLFAFQISQIFNGL